MSDSSPNARFIASADDPSRAAPVPGDEYGHLIADLHNVVMPQLARVAADLTVKGFRIVKLEQRAALASLIVKNTSADVSGWLYFQVHRSFGPLLSSERLFWMYSVRNGDDPEKGEPGRLPNLDDPTAVRIIADTFAAACEAMAAKE